MPLPSFLCPMKLAHLIPLFTLVALAGCSSQPADTDQRPTANASLTPQQNLEKIKNDPNIPDGLKKIQTDTLQRQAGIKP